MTDSTMVVEVNVAPVHQITLVKTEAEGQAKAVCSCGYTSIVSFRQRAYRMGKSHVEYHRKKWAGVV